MRNLSTTCYKNKNNEESIPISTTMRRSLSLSDISTFIKHDDDDQKDILKTVPKGISQASPRVQGTTLLQPVHYSGGIDKDEKEYYMKQHEMDQFDREYTFSDFETVIHNPGGFNEGECSIDVVPAIQVMSISIFNKDLSWNGSLINGDVSVIDSNDRVFSIYKRKPGRSDRISPDQSELSLVEFPIAPVLKGKVAFSLFNQHGAQIFKWDSYVDYLINDGGVNKEELIVQGRDDHFAIMVYTIMPYALIAEIEDMDLIGPNRSYFDLEGNIRANGINILKSNIIPGEKMALEQPTKRRAIAVPVYSSFLAEGSLIIGGTEFDVGPLEVKNLGKFFEETLFFEFEDIKHYLQMNIAVVGLEKYFRLITMTYPPVNYDHYVEVFSVFVGGGTSTPALCGTVVVRDIDETVYIFSRNKECPDNLVRFRRIVSLTWPNRWVLENNFYMHLKLMDVKGRQVCRGGLNLHREGVGSYANWLDRRMCAVIRGHDGYFAAVHYSIFRFALQAKVIVSVESEGHYDNFDVYGSVYAEYNNYDYSSAYDKEYYRLIIFDRPEEYRANVKIGSKIPLSKSLITAPSDCGWLSVFVSLTVRPFRDSYMVSSDLFATRNIQFTASTNESVQLPLYRRGDGVHRRGHVTIKLNWFGCRQ